MTLQDQVREHTFDGIQEFDNRLPNWWLWSFYLACIFSVFYWIHFHTLGTGALPVEAWQQEEQAANKQLEELMAKNPVTEASLLKLVDEPASVAEGRNFFVTNCVACHKPDASGNIGPNLTDEWWIHGGKPMDIYNTVFNGVLQKGMQNWGVTHGPVKVQQVVAYLLKEVKGKNRPGKKPEPDAKKEQ